MSTSVKRKAYIRDMTQGNIVKHILLFALPMIAANACQQIYNLVDTMVAGHNLGDSAIAAIGAVSALYGLMINITNGFNSGCGVVVTQYFGSHDLESLKKSVTATYLCNAVLTILVTLISLFGMGSFLKLLNVPGSIYHDAYMYIMIICAGMLTTVLYNMFAGIMRAFGNSRVPLIIVIISSVIHVGLDVLFIVWLHMGVAGTAIATVLSQGISAVIAWIYTVRHYGEYLPSVKEMQVEKEIVGQVVRIGIGMSLTLCVVNVGGVLFMGANNSLGDIYITAYTSARRIIDLAMIPVNTLAAGATTFAAQNWGAKEYGRIRQGIRKLLVMQIIWSLFAIAVVFLFGEQIIAAETGTANAEIIRNAVTSLRIHLPLYPILSVLFAFRMTLQGMGYTTVTVISSSIEMLFKLFASFSLIPRYGFIATCVTEPITWVMCAVYLTAAYFILVKRGLYSGKNS